MMDILASMAPRGTPPLPLGTAGGSATSGADFAIALQQVIAPQETSQPEAAQLPQAPETNAPVFLAGSASTVSLSPSEMMPPPDLVTEASNPPEPAPASEASEPTIPAEVEHPAAGPAEPAALLPSGDAGQIVAIASQELPEAPSSDVPEEECETSVVDGQLPRSLDPEPEAFRNHQIGFPQKVEVQPEPSAESPPPVRTDDALQTIPRDAPTLSEGNRRTPVVVPVAQPAAVAEQPAQPSSPGAAALSPVPAAQSIVPAHAPEPSVPLQSEAQPPRLSLHDPLGERLGLVIARRLGEGGEEVQIRMDPAELGRIHVRLSFDEGGSLRAVVAADSPQLLDAIRRDAADLERALAEAGVRTDAQSFRFDRGGGSGGGSDMPRQWAQQSPDRAGNGSSDPEPSPNYRPLRRSSRLDLMA